MSADLYPEPRQTLCVDFDGVIYPYSHGWADGIITEAPIPGAIEALWALREAGYAIVIHTTRCREPGQAGHIRAWLEDHGAPVIYKVTAQKVPALAYIDDRAVRFTNWNDIRKRFA